MKIAHIVCTYPPYYGGMGNVVFQTASELAKLGHEVEVLTPGFYEPKEIKSVEAPVEKIHTASIEKQIDYATRLKPSLQYGNSAYIPQIKNELDRFDLVHLHYPFFGTANLVRKWKLQNPHKPLVITYHMDNRSPGWKGLFFKYYANYWLPKILGSANLLIGSSLDFIGASDALEIYRQNPKKWLELPFGVDIERFKPRNKPLDLFDKYGLDPDKPTLLFVGGMDQAHYFKGIPVLLDALLILKKNNFSLQTILVGEGDLRHEFEQRAISYGLNNFLRFAGEINDEDLPYYYNMADLFVLPSINQAEAFGMVLLEAMASGVPVVASDLPGVRSVAKDGGVTFKPGDANSMAEVIYAYFSQNKDQDQFKISLRGLVEEKYAWGPIIKQLDTIYQQLV